MNCCKNKQDRKVLGLLVIVLLLISQCALAAVAPQDMTFVDYGLGYHLKDFLNGYNVLAFGNAHMDLHLMGSILVEGNYSGGGGNSGFADGTDLPPSYVKGMITASSSIYNSRNSQTNQPLYVGSSNTVTAVSSNGETLYKVNNLNTGNGGRTPAYVNDNFFNFDEAYKVVKADQQTMVNRAQKAVVPSGYYVTLNVNVGDNVVIESLAGIGTINIVGDATQEVNTTISVLDVGDITMPWMTVNGSQPSVQEQNAKGTSLVWNIPNASYVELPTMNWLGHVIAPDATVSLRSGNYNGCIVCKNFSTGAEGHVYNYTAMETSWDIVFSLEKNWVDGNDADGIRPDSIKVDLMANGKKVETVTLTEEDGWYYVWNDLAEKDKNGNTITYSVVEHEVKGYTSQYNPDTQTLINTHEPAIISLSGSKTWANEMNFGSRMRPMYITVRLYADGEEIQSKTITVTSETSQSYSFENLPKYKNGREIKYAVHEDTVPGYIATQSEDLLSLTNTWGGEAIEVFGTKTWVDDNNRDGKRPASITVQLLANGEVVDEHIVTAQNNWNFMFGNLPSQDKNGKAIEYTVREKTVPDGYTVSYSGYNITNTHEIERIQSLSGRKTWNDSDNNDGMRPSSINVILLADGVRFSHKTITAEDGWEWEFVNLPRYQGGKEIRYNVIEDAVEGYTSQTNGMNLTNTHVKETVKVSGSKIWADDNNRDGKRPESITINLFADGKKVDEKKVTAAENWAWSFEGLDKYKNGTEISYTITEDAVKGYTSKVSGYDVTNTHEIETVELNISKFWKDSDNQDGIRPQSVTVRLYKQLAKSDSPVEVDSITVKPDASGNWTGKFDRLPKYENGREIIYTVREDAVPGYTASYNGFEITNTHVTETVKVTGDKTWDDNNDQDGKRPDKIAITLFADGAKVDEKIVSKKNNWAWSFDNLPKYKNGNRIIYTIEENTHDSYTVDIHRTNLQDANGVDEYHYDVTNSYEPDTVHIAGEKRWIDSSNQDGKRPESITIRLWVGGNEIANKLVTAQDNWSWSFTGLPRYADGQEITYTITEDPVPGYTTQVSGHNVINTHAVETIAVSGAKTWNDSNNQDGKRPESITIRLHKQVGSAASTEINHKIITNDEGWSWSFTDLPRYENGQEIVYSITEDKVDHYTTTVNGYNVINSYETEKTSVSGSKTWDDSNNQDGIRPASITIRLLANGSEVASKVVTAADGWAWNFASLPVYANGKTIAYSITEDAVAGYTSIVNGFNVTNTHKTETISVSGSKTWDDNNNQDGKRPDHVIVALYADGLYTSQYRNVSSRTNWEWKFDNLPKYKNVNGTVSEIVYTLVEDPVPGYTAIPDGYDITNSHVVETVEITGRKIWNDSDNQLGMRPDSITINLLANGSVIKSQQVSADSFGSWSWTFSNLPKYNAGKEISYAISEEKVHGYETSYPVGTYDVINTYSSATISVPVMKIWNDDNDRDGLRPESITVQLLANGKVAKEHILSAQNNWRFVFNNLPTLNKKGKQIEYTVKEKDVPDGYKVSYSGYNIINTHEVERIQSLSGKKIWNDADNNDGMRPSSINVILLADGVRFSHKTITAADGWAWEFVNLPKYNGGKEVKYTVIEDAVEGYTSRTDGMNLINTHVNETVEVSGSKTWVDDNNRDGMRPASITINLLANGKKVAEKKVTAADNWSWSFKGLDKYKNGTEITYSVAENDVNGYTVNVSGYNITNTREIETVEIGVSKLWKDSDNQDGIRPHSITIRLYKQLSKSDTPAEVDTFTVKPDAHGNWIAVLGHLPKYENGREIIYTIREDAVPGYTASYNGFEITNTHIAETVKITGHKIWKDNNDQDGKCPDSITISLFADGAKVGEKTVTQKNNWAWSFDDLPKYRAGHRIVYTIEEDVHDGYTVDIHRTNQKDANGNDEYHYDVTNTYEPETVHIAGEKRWIDNNNQDGMRPESITVHLWADGNEIAKKTVTAQDNWVWNFTGLPRYAAGQEITYTITEDPVPGYTTQISGHNVINAHEAEMIEVSGAKTWDDNNNQDGKRPASITIRLYKQVGNGAAVEIDHKIITNDEGWSWSFTDLPRYENGQEIVYSITEDKVDHYTTTVNGYNVTNSYETEKVSVSGSKTWDDSNNQDGIRPASITIRLLANGSEVASKTVTAADGWAWTFTSLPRYANGKAIAYSITEDAVAGYTSIVNGFNVTNTHKSETISVSGSKTWDDNNNQDGKRPDHVIVSLYADGRYTSQYRNVSARTGWKWTFDNLPKYKNVNGTISEIVYTLAEGPVPGYTAVFNGYNITNTYSAETVRVLGRKIWNDGDNQDNKRPASITINLLANGTLINSRQVSPDSYGNWTWDFGNLPKYSAGKEIIYSVTEEKVEGYVTSYINGTYDVVNTYNVSRTSVPVTKTWLGDDHAAGRRPDSIMVRLWANGREIDSKVITAQEGWTGSFENLPSFSKGNAITYTITEDRVPGYNASINGYQITNTYALTDFAVTKVWEGGSESADIDLTLYANGAKLNPQPPCRRIGDVYAWKDLAKFDANGTEIVYSALEAPMTGYTVRYINANGAANAAYNGGTIVNSAMVDISVRKVWKGLAKNAEKPEIELTLYCDGQPLDIAQPQPDPDGWYTYANLPVAVNGHNVVYTVKETPVSGFTTTYANENGAKDAAYHGGTIYNKSTSKLPDTGDHFPMIPCIIALFMSLTGMVILKKRKKTT